MPKTDFLKDLASQLTESVPSHLSTLKKDFEKNCHRILTKTFAKFDLVTREEFDIQTKVLARTRKKLEELEAHVKSLEEKLKGKHRAG
ncbi:MAG: accessory factor UbiK family protein [Gammaproteobacteria bacterium]|nr:accessory factor UbiK family protein [Gammaproteobacteria bacterium]MCW5582519.1 accessory factor UbiK family protein [Gammaproteobacteria bacterium]